MCTNSTYVSISIELSQKSTDDPLDQQVSYLCMQCIIDLKYLKENLSKFKVTKLEIDVP